VKYGSYQYSFSGSKTIVTEIPQKFDAIVIGSGIGGLTTAALLAKQNKRVLVLEQHFTPGGFTHGFERKGKFHWDVGLHYIGEMGEGSPYRSIFNYLTNGKLKWQQMPDLFDKFVYPDFTFAVNANVDRFKADLIQQFPQEKAGINKYFKDIQSAATWFIIHYLFELFPAFLQPLLKLIFRQFGKIATQTTQNYLDRHFQSVPLKAVLASQWGDYGLTPAQSCFGIHGVVVTHYFSGGWYPVGGGSAIAPPMIETIERAGGKVMTQRRVTEIIIKSGVAIGVKVANAAHPNREPEIYSAPKIVSDAGAFNTYVKLIPSSVSVPYRESILNFPKGEPVFTLYLGLKESAQKLGFQGENHWIYDTYDHEEIGQARSIDSHNLPQFAYLSFPSLKNDAARGHTAEIISSANYDDFGQWQGRTWRKRGNDYNELKSQIANSLIQFVESHYPGFQDLIEYAELSTPLTIEHFNASDCGSIYGIPCIPQRLEQPWIASKTPIENLYLTGTDTFSPGIVGSMMGGVKTASLMNGSFGFLKIMANIIKG
jgi:all-trans-retinol 13,14-reductase